MTIKELKEDTNASFWEIEDGYYNFLSMMIH